MASNKINKLSALRSATRYVINKPAMKPKTHGLRNRPTTINELIHDQSEYEQEYAGENKKIYKSPTQGYQN